MPRRSTLRLCEATSSAALRTTGGWWGWAEGCLRPRASRNTAGAQWRIGARAACGSDHGGGGGAD